MSDAACSCRYVLKLTVGEAFAFVGIRHVEERSRHWIESKRQLGREVGKAVGEHKIVRGHGTPGQAVHSLHEFCGRHIRADGALDIADIGLGTAKAVGKLLLLQTFFDPPLRQPHVRTSLTTRAGISADVVYCDRLYFLARDKEEGGSEYKQMPYGVIVMRPGNRLRTLRKKADLTQIELADRTGVSQSAISQIENGEVSMTIQWMKAFARALHCAPVDLLDDEDNPDRLDDRERALLDIYRHSTEQEQATIEKVVPAISSYHPPEVEQASA